MLQSTKLFTDRPEAPFTTAGNQQNHNKIPLATHFFIIVRTSFENYSLAYSCICTCTCRQKAVANSQQHWICYCSRRRCHQICIRDHRAVHHWLCQHRQRQQTSNNRVGLLRFCHAARARSANEQCVIERKSSRQRNRRENVKDGQRHGCGCVVAVVELGTRATAASVRSASDSSKLNERAFLRSIGGAEKSTKE